MTEDMGKRIAVGVEALSGGGGGAVTIADGADAALGAKADTAASSDTGTFSLIALVKRLLAKIPIIGRGLSAASVSVTLASDHAEVPTKTADGSDVALGTTTDAAKTAAEDGSVNARLRDAQGTLDNIDGKTAGPLSVAAPAAVSVGGSWQKLDGSAGKLLTISGQANAVGYAVVADADVTFPGPAEDIIPVGGSFGPAQLAAGAALWITGNMGDTVAVTLR